MAGPKESKAKVVNAFRAMKAIGISEEKVKPVLKTLLKLYDKNWEYIEEENYRVLADAIFEKEEEDAQENVEKVVNDEAPEASERNLNAESPMENNLEKKAEPTQEAERPLKRLRRGSREGQTSALNITSNGLSEHSTLLKPKDEPNELPDACAPNIPASSQGGLESHEPNTGNLGIDPPDDLPCRSSAKNKGKRPISPNTSIAVEPNGGVSQSQKGLRIESRTPSRSMRLRDGGMGSVSSEVASKEKRSVPENSSKKNSNSPAPLLKPKDEPVTDEMPCLEAATRVNNPESTNEEPSGGNCVSRKTCSLQPLSFPPSEKDSSAAASGEFKANDELTKDSSHNSPQLEIASSLSGEVKISFIYDVVRGRPRIHSPPSVGAVMKSMEDKYLISRRTSGSSVPLMDLMKEMCEFFVNIGADPSYEMFLRTLSSSHRNVPDDGSPSNNVDDTNMGQENEPSKGDDTNAKHMGQENEPSKGDVVPKLALLTPEIGTSVSTSVDVAKGHEKVVISLVNEVNDEPPPTFHYIPQNTVFQNAYLHFSLARIADNCCSSCSADCLSSPIPCACAHETGGEFAYTADGLVREELLKECISMNRDPKRHCQFFCKECPLERSKKDDSIEACKGHLVRKFIKECWQKCGCDKRCGNRVVQRGITRNLQVFMSPGGKGWGLRTLEDLPKGAFVCEYVGEVLTNSELFERVQQSREGERHFYPVLLDADWSAEGVLKDEEALCLDATYYGNVGRFINHRCYDSNLVEIPVEVETPDHHYYHLAYFTTRKVKAMEELTWDYGIDFDDLDHPIKAFQCQCGSKFCRNIKRSRTRSRR